MLKAIHPTGMVGLLLLEPQVFGDARGYFLETFSQRELAEVGVPDTFVQDNLSCSVRGTLRGLHYQAPPHGQAKLVTVLEGLVRDVVVDLRVGSPTYGQHYAVDLSADNHLFLYVPVGFAHGFAVLSERCLFMYKCSQYYHKPSEGGLLWNDPALGIDWGLPPGTEPILSAKDLELPTLAALQSPFVQAALAQ